MAAMTMIRLTPRRTCSKLAVVFGTLADNGVMRVRAGFTLAELLIALLILGVIATFTIPKVLSSQQDTRRKAVIKEVAGMLSGAFQAYRQDNAITASLHGGHLSPYMNYVRADVSMAMDAYVGNPSTNCNGGQPCLVLHNGAVMRYQTNGMGTVDTTTAIWFEIDPTAGASGANSPEGIVELWLYTNGRIVSWSSLDDDTCYAAFCVSADPNKDPPWWGWN